MFQQYYYYRQTAWLSEALLPKLITQGTKVSPCLRAQKCSNVFRHGRHTQRVQAPGSKVVGCLGAVTFDAICAHFPILTSERAVLGSDVAQEVWRVAVLLKIN
jgi:hypothetical protein